MSAPGRADIAGIAAPREDSRMFRPGGGQAYRTGDPSARASLDFCLVVW
jgi:hypothetical protein